VARLLARGESVRIFTRDPEKPARLGLDFTGAELRRGDLTRPWELFEALEGCRALINVAHIRHTRTCVRACRAVGARRLILMSSTRRYTRWPCETSRAVLRGEAAARAASDLDWTIIRPTMIFGGARDNNITRLMRWVARHRWVPLVDGGRALIQPVFVEDLADLLVAILENPASFRAEFTVAGAAPLTYRQLWEEIARIMGRQIRFVPVPGALAERAAWLAEKLAPGLRVRAEQVRRLREDKAFDFTEARERLGFHPRAVEAGLREKWALLQAAGILESR